MEKYIELARLHLIWLPSRRFEVRGNVTDSKHGVALAFC